MDIKTLFYCVSFLFFYSCSSEQAKQKINDKEIEVLELRYFNLSQDSLEAAIINDFYSPPVASRFYLYPYLTAYSVIGNFSARNSPNIFYTKKLNNLEKKILAILSFNKIASKMLFTKSYSTHVTNQFIEDLLKIGYDKNHLDSLVTLSDTLSQQMLIWSNKDNYKTTRSGYKYVLKKSEGFWKPTPPDYSDALEPNWFKLRLLLADSASQFRPSEPIKYETNRNSLFYLSALEVFNYSNKKSITDSLTAEFWDCNPLLLKRFGHATIPEKKLTPGGHWIKIGKNLSLSQALSFEKSCKLQFMLAIGIYESFISCWETKYHYNYIRPITFIQESINPKWHSTLITPNFPEYTSGHSVVSACASEILSYFFTSNLPFVDSSEVSFGRPPRTFDNFFTARDEAAISRFYGGIHFKQSIEKGIEQGSQIGKFILKKIP